MVTKWHELLDQLSNLCTIIINSYSFIILFCQRLSILVCNERNTSYNILLHVVWTVPKSIPLLSENWLRPLLDAMVSYYVLSWETQCMLKQIQTSCILQGMPKPSFKTTPVHVYQFMAMTCTWTCQMTLANSNPTILCYKFRNTLHHWNFR
jgi:hypothetical protein